VGDVVRGTLMLANDPRCFGQVYNIGTSEEVSVLNLAERVKAAAGSSSPIEFVPFEKIYGDRFEDMQRRVPSLKKIHDLVGYAPQCTLDELLRTTVAFYRDRKRTPYRQASAIPSMVGGA
jgi:UDP-glucose 4-epimerase